MRCIIPAAGLGTRVNMKPNESKELKILYGGRPIIEQTLDICTQHYLSPLVVTRKEKKDLIQYCKDHGIEYQIIDPTGEWPETVLKSKKYWEEFNVLMLPDVIFEDSKKVMADIKMGLMLGNSSVFALHHVSDHKNWGIIQNYNLTEKPQDLNCGLAWGLIGFKKEYGSKLFTAMKTRNVPFKLKNVGFTYLDLFKDITRGS